MSDKHYTADDPSVAWTLPSLTYSGLLPISDAGGTDFAWDTNYTNFWRDKGVDAQVVELSGVPDAICGLQEGAQNTMTTTDVALLMHMQ